jgi:hypothetical protein
MKATDLAKVTELSAHLEHLKVKLDFVETETWAISRVMADGSIEPLDPRSFNVTKSTIGARELLKALTMEEINTCKRDLISLGVDFDEPPLRLAAPVSEAA